MATTSFNIKHKLHQIKVNTFNIIVHQRINLPSSVGIEISAACNRRCYYCPQSIEPMKQQIIEPKVFSQFIDRVREYRWRGMVGLTKYNELALVPNSEEYVRRVAEAGARPVIFTNGDFPDTIVKWIDAGAFRVHVTQHPPEKDNWAEKLEPVRKKYPFRVTVRKLPWIHNQAGKLMTVGDRFDVCYQANGLSINIDGTVSMCCLDYSRAYLVGDIMKQSFDEVWNGDRFKAIRERVTKGIPATRLCGGCLTIRP